MGGLAIIAASTGQIGRLMDVAQTPYPPSFANNSWLFAWALFARILILSLSAATIVRIASKNRMERVAPNHPVYYHRMTVTCFLWGALLGASSDVLTYLFWNEVGPKLANCLYVVSRMLDGMTMVPFLMAMFVPLWLRWLCEVGVLKSAPSLTLNGVINDVRATWDSKTVPLKLLAYSGVGSAAVTVGKYWFWLENGRP